MYFDIMENLTTHYRQLLGLPATWAVDDVNLSLTDQLIAVRLRFIGECNLRPESLPAFHGVSVRSVVLRR